MGRACCSAARFVWCPLLIVCFLIAWPDHYNHHHHHHHHHLHHRHHRHQPHHRGQRQQRPAVQFACGLLLGPPNRTRPAESIVLENGSTAFVSSSLEEFLEANTREPHLKNVSHQSLSIVGSPAAQQQQQQQQQQQIRSQLQHETEEFARAEENKKQQQHASISHERQANNENQRQHHHQESQHGAGGNTSAPNKPIPQHWQVKSLLNVTHDYPLEYSRVICGYVWPVMAAITLFTNLMIVFVLTQRDMRTPTNVVLAAIAIADIIPIVVPVPWFVYLFAMGNEKQVLYPPIVCYFYQHSTRSVSEIFYFLSTWLNVLLAVQDYLTACWPKLAKKYCQIRVVVIEIVALTLLAFLLNSPQALKLVFKPVKFYYNGELTWGCKALQARWFKDLVGEYVALYDDIFTAIIVVFVDGGPAIALITLTALLIRQLHRQRIQGHLLMEQARTASKRRRERHRQQEYEASARVMIFVLLAFLAVKIPFATTYTLMIIQSRFEIHFVENLVDFQKAITLTDLVFVLSYPINFTIFCCCSKKFRHKCAQLLGECNHNTKSARNRLMSSFSSSFNSDTTLSQFQFNATTTTTNNNNNNPSCGGGTGGGASGAQKRNSSATTIGGLMMLTSCRQSKQPQDSVGLLANEPAARRNSELTISGEYIGCNGSAPRKLSQQPMASQPDAEDELDPTGASHQRQQQQQQRRPSLLGPALGGGVPSPILEDVVGSQESMRVALADDGLCIECIMRYEQLKRSSTNSAGQQQQQLQQFEHQLQHQRRQSTDSAGSSWPISMPPPPPPLQFAAEHQQRLPHDESPAAGGPQLPHIVCTSTCDSVRSMLLDDHEAGQSRRASGSCASSECNSDLAAAGAAGAAAAASSSSQASFQHHYHRPASAAAAAPLSPQASCSSSAANNRLLPIGGGGGGSGADQTLAADGDWSRGRHLNRRSSGYSERGASDPGLMRSTPRAHSTGGDSTASQQQQQQQQYHHHHYHQAAGRSGDSASNELVSLAGSVAAYRRDRADADGDHHHHHHSQQSQQQHQPHQGRPHRLKAPRLGQMEDRHRSMSMSNSKLTALAGATGLLAGIIKTTLLSSEPDQETAAAAAAASSQRTPAGLPMHFFPFGAGPRTSAKK